MFSSPLGLGNLDASDFVLSVSGGTAELSSATPISIAHDGSNVYSLGIGLSEVPNGTEILTVTPAASSIYDKAAREASTSQSNNTATLNPVAIQRGTDIDAEGGMVFPTYCDSHTHLVFAASREGEFVDRINGLSYEEIAKRGGGILNSAAKLQNATEEELYKSALNRLNNLIKLGTGAIEIKSGYGLTLESVSYTHLTLPTKA